MTVLQEKKAVPRQRQMIKTCAIYGIAIILGLIIANSLFGYLSSPKCLVKERNIPINYAKISSAASLKLTPTLNSTLSIPLKGLPPSSVTSVKNEIPNKVSEEKRAALVLNGIFIAKDNCYAIINNRIVKKGDVIDGATVVQITMEEVELETEAIKFKLSTKEYNKSR